MALRAIVEKQKFCFFANLYRTAGLRKSCFWVKPRILSLMSMPCIGKCSDEMELKY
jgi:hypothetical protein